MWGTAEKDYGIEIYLQTLRKPIWGDKHTISGLNWVFEHVDRAIILQDDCFPTLQYFDFCKGMLEKCEKQKDISYIASGTYVKIKKEIIVFLAEVGSTWGWATWSDRWQKYKNHCFLVRKLCVFVNWNIKCTIVMGLYIELIGENYGYRKPFN